jgi:hypothetical protein
MRYTARRVMSVLGVLFASSLGHHNVGKDVMNRTYCWH